jgi:hypothetical protein
LPLTNGIFKIILHIQTLWGSLSPSPWKKISNIRLSLLKNMKLVVRLTMRHSGKVLYSNNVISVMMCWKPTALLSFLVVNKGRKNINTFRDLKSQWHFQPPEPL